MKIFFKVFGGFLLLLLVLAVSTITRIDRTPYQQLTFYAEMDQRLDSLAENYQLPQDSSTFQIGWSKLSITPARPLPLAGYGARDPKQMTGIHDSSFVRTVIFKKGQNKAAFITADLLIVHPEVSRRVFSSLPAGWKPGEIYFTASHTHSGLGSWGPGLVGNLFAGPYEPEVVESLSNIIVSSINAASDQLDEGGVAYGDTVVDELVRNRVRKEGTVDSSLRLLLLRSGSRTGLVNFFGAHATCFSDDFHKLSGDYPSKLNKLLEKDSLIDFAAYGAGAVGSMGPGGTYSGQACVDFLSENLKSQIDLFMLMAGANTQQPDYMRSFRLQLPFGKPQFKISRDFAVRPYIFRQAFGDYQNHISILSLGKTLLIGMPCDFSGELAIPLYRKARNLGLNLIITSFNGDYMGYVIRDEWYDLPSYEARTMSWYGPDTGSYLSEVASRIIDIIHKNQQPTP